MALPDFSMRQLLEAGAHFGHQSHRWNPKMSQYIFGTRNNIHIIDLAQTVPMLYRALQAVSDTVAEGRPRALRRHEAPGLGRDRRRGQALGAVLRQLALARRHADQLEDDLGLDLAPAQARRDARPAAAAPGLTKKERLMLAREKEKLEKALGGIKDMGGTPDLLFVIDTNKEQLAIKEAQRLGIPVAAIVDTNCESGRASPSRCRRTTTPGRAISLYCDLVARAAIDGISRGQGELGLDIGAAETPIIEELPANANVAPEQVEQFELLTAPRGAPDDLTKLNGVGPQLEKKLNDAGIFHYWQLAAMKPEDVDEARHRSQAPRPHRARRLDRPGPRR